MLSVRRPIAAVSSEAISSLLMDGGQDVASLLPSAPKYTCLRSVSHGASPMGTFHSLQRLRRSQIAFQCVGFKELPWVEASMSLVRPCDHMSPEPLRECCVTYIRFARHPLARRSAEDSHPRVSVPFSPTRPDQHHARVPLTSNVLKARWRVSGLTHLLQRQLSLSCVSTCRIMAGRPCISFSVAYRNQMLGLPSPGVSKPSSCPPVSNATQDTLTYFP